MRFTDKICVITGGGSGIGKAICLRLATEGGKVVVIDIQDSGQQTADEIVERNGQSIFIKTDVSQGNEVEAAIGRTVQLWGKIDVLVNNAAIMTFKPIRELTEEEWDQVMAVNMKSAFLFCKYSLPYMNRAAIVNISSVHYHDTTPHVIPYASSKGALETFTRGMSVEYDIEKVRVNCVAPGAVDTPMLWRNPNVKSGMEKIEGKIGKPEDVAAAVSFIASDEASFINGSSLHVDGGRLNIL